LHAADRALGHQVQQHPPR
ncbi:hypothetical protein BAE44_0024210, partial [Dichanthelium oligosanthes]